MCLSDCKCTPVSYTALRSPWGFPLGPTDASTAEGSPDGLCGHLPGGGGGYSVLPCYGSLLSQGSHRTYLPSRTITAQEEQSLIGSQRENYPDALTSFCFVLFILWNSREGQIIDFRGANGNHLFSAEPSLSFWAINGYGAVPLL